MATIRTIILIMGMWGLLHAANAEAQAFPPPSTAASDYGYLQDDELFGGLSSAHPSNSYSLTTFEPNPGPYLGGPILGGTYQTSASATEFPDATVTLASTGTNLIDYYSNDNVSYIVELYGFYVTGPTVGSSVVIDIRGNITVSASQSTSDSNYAIALGGIQTSNSGDDSANACLGPTCAADGLPPTFSGTFSYPEVVGTQDILYISAQTAVDGPASFANVTVDPYIYIDPSTPDASAYSIIVPTGVGNSSSIAAAVPEPSTYAFFLGGISLAGLLGCRRRRSLECKR